MQLCFLTTDTFKTDGTEESLHSADESEAEEMVLSLQICKTIDFLVFAL